MGKAIRLEDANLVSRTNVAASRPLFTNEVAAKSFQSCVIKFSAADLAQAAHRTKNAAKGWKDGSRAPDIASMVNMAQSLPAVRDWVALRCGIERVMQARSWDAWLAGLYAIAAGSGPDAEKARWAIARLTNEVTTETILRDSLTVIDRREAKAVAVEKEKSTPRRRA